MWGTHWAWRNKGRGTRERGTRDRARNEGTTRGRQTLSRDTQGTMSKALALALAITMDRAILSDCQIWYN